MDKDIKFSFGRMMRVLRLEIMEDCKRNVYNVVLLYGIMLLPLLLILLFSDVTAFEEVSDKFRLVAVFVSFWGMSYVAANIMKPMRTKGGRLLFLMLPATNLEKFVARFLLVTVGYIVAFAVSMIAIDITYQLIVFIFQLGSDCYGSLSLGLFEFYDGISVMFNSATYDISLDSFLTLSSSLFQHSFFILGGCLWYKLSFVKTLAAMYILGFASSFAVFLVQYTMVPDLFLNTDWEAFLIVVSILELCVAVGMYYLSYRLFTRAQIISRSNFILQ